MVRLDLVTAELSDEEADPRYEHLNKVFDPT